ncbi:MAG: hypothetical protein UU93_C0011G0017 [Candidatus Amesbacteria bacterium GW2011_GWA2_42_12]|uniref:DUF3800 domain-containing protein n=1 Tax=Candidatus Amesbacteria bacterium GW2011_GWA2_42_12 TaxID=1618356 RepID=A0A0G1AD64_9BACT|nr:MAG: hypothetical protein UU93_C0011G0017 [Candidatus Amesbacteria bacterium GW2011_GWA2_42_12]
MQSYKLLSLDESGKASFNHPSKLFILSGVVIPEKLKTKVDSQMRKIKKKFFGNEEVVLHGRDMARAGSQFVALSDAKVAGLFWSEFVSIVNNPEISLYFVVTDKTKAKSANWQFKTILERSYLRILSEFARNLKTTDHCGRIINESDSEQDPYLIYAHNRLQSNDTGDGGVSGKEYQKMVTSLSLVNKTNHDVDLQIADTVAFVGRLRYEKELLGKTHTMTVAEKMKYRLIDRKVNNAANPGMFEVLI